MPELPEVETIKNELLPKILGRRFTEVNVVDPKILRQPSVEEFRRVVGKKIVALKRRGKYLLFYLSNGEILIAHLKMAGALLLNKPDRYTRVLFHLDNGDQLIFSDRRRFAVMWLVKDEATIVGKLGPEPLTSDFTPEIFAECLKKREGSIKAVLLDQHFIAGVGNMYADEALFEAGIHPEKKANSFTNQEIGKLYQALRLVLQKAIKEKGASVNSYLRPGGELGEAHFSFKVRPQNRSHQSKGCPRCGSLIQRILIRNRGTYFCPNCQPLA